MGNVNDVAMRVYIAGPMESAGGNLNFPLFDYVAQRLRDEGCDEVFNPAEYARKRLGSFDDIRRLSKSEMKAARLELMTDELHWICTKATLVFMLPGWMQSLGARAEHAVALARGIDIREMPNIVLPEFISNSNQVAIR